jgi:adenosine deaminase
MKIFRLIFVYAIALPLAAQTANPLPASGEARAQHALEAAKKAGAPELYAFLKNFPKGADLHMHLSGAIYAETFLAEGAKQGLCVDPVKLAFAQPGDKGKCVAGQVTAADAIQNQSLYDKLIDSFSMRSFVPRAGYSGHDQFFDTFDRFSGLKNVQGDWLDEVATRAAAQNEQYLEIMQTPSFNNAIAAANKVGWPVGPGKAISSGELAALRTALFAAGLRNDVAIDSKELSDAQAQRTASESCADYERYKEDMATWSAENRPGHGEVMQMENIGPGCSVKMHWIYQVLRGFSPQQVFAQTLLGFELASVDPDIVGINFVRAEDRRDAMEEYHTEMLMLDYLHSVYPKVHITLHAGELAPGLVPPGGLSFHIREAIELGHAERIGHGVDVLHEVNSSGNEFGRQELRPLLKEMAEKHIDVEVNLTSNEVILGVKGSEHPLHAYMAAHVPFSLSTDDEGVSRIDLTHEYVKAVEEQNLSYADLKYSARNSLEYSFLHGESLYIHSGDYAHRSAACAAPVTVKPSSACAAFLSGNEKAAQQYELERRFAEYEASLK